MEINSREYAKFKRTFVGPPLPRRIRKERNIGGSHPMPAEKPLKHNSETKQTIKHFMSFATYDWRNVRYCNNINQIITPRWANKSKIKELYHTAKKLTEQTGVRHEVDHIIPKRHPLICGLHVEHNLQILQRTDNLQKTNTFNL
jgi:5-methylcytosine-specific restriction endonuclease McrA